MKKEPRITEESKEYIQRVKDSEKISAHEKAIVIYGRMVEDAHLFDKAFFGHKTSKREKKRLDHLWELAQRLGGLDEKGRTPTPKPGGVHRPVGDQGSTINVNASSEGTG